MRYIVIGSVVLVLLLAGVVGYSIHQKHKMESDIAFLKAQEAAELKDENSYFIQINGEKLKSDTQLAYSGYQPSPEESQLNRIADQGNQASEDRIYDRIRKNWEDKIRDREAGREVDMTPYVPQHTGK